MRAQTKTKQEREAEVKEEVQRLREAMEHLSGSAQGLARQRDDARAALAKAKGILRRMGPVRGRYIFFPRKIVISKYEIYMC